MTSSSFGLRDFALLRDVLEEEEEGADGRGSGYFSSAALGRSCSGCSGLIENHQSY